MAARKASSVAKSRPEQPLTDRLVDEALADSFPASDPPFFVGAGAVRVSVTEADAAVAREERRLARQDRH